MKRFLSIIFLVIFSLSLASCSRISNPTPESCYNFRCEVTDEDKVFVIEGDDAKSIYSECNKNMQNATLSSDAIGTGEYIKIKFIGDTMVLPIMTKEQCDFDGWYKTSNLPAQCAGCVDPGGNGPTEPSTSETTTAPTAPTTPTTPTTPEETTQAPIETTTQAPPEPVVSEVAE